MVATSRRSKFSPDLNLFQMGVVLVGVPLVLELVCISVLFYLYKAAEEQSKRVEHTRNVRSVSDRIINGYASAGTAVLEYSFKRDQESRTKYQNFRRHSARNLDKLREMLKNEPQHAEVLKIAESNGKDLSAALDIVYERLTAQKPEEYMSTRNILELSRQRQFIIKYLMRASRQLADFSNTLDRESEREEAANIFRKLFEGFLAAFVVMNILVAVGLAAFFGNTILKRIGIVKDNTLRLASGRELNTRLQGSDEIAELDSGFHRMAKALAEAQRKEKAVIDSAPDVICSIDQDGRFLTANPAVSEKWGMTQDEVVGKRYSEILVAEDVQQTTQTLNRIHNERGFGQVECRVSHKQGHDVHMLWAVRWSETDKVLFCVLHDISERKELEQLRQHFIAMVSHDLRTPLSSVKNFLGMLNSPIYGSLNDKGNLRKVAVEQEIDRLHRLIDDLLDLEKMETGKMELELRPTRVSSVLKLAFEAVRGVAEQKNIEVDFPHGEEREVEIDGERIIQVLVNLLSNAVKFAPPDSKVTVTAAIDDAYLDIAVSDNGPGLPAGAEKTLFSRFKQFAKGPDAPKGSGLGLAICKEIVSAHNGTIGADSEEGKGCKFWFRIPIS